ncbi:MAG: N,N-dimethylformamidase beta subunit family domain-containing protein [Aestuariivirga sp.]
MMREYNTVSLTVEGYPARLSYRPGDRIVFHCSSRAPTFSVEIARIGAEREVVFRRDGIAGEEREVLPHSFAAGARWPETFEVVADPNWRSGFYEVAFTAAGVSGAEPTSHEFFVLRAAHLRKSGNPLLVLSTNTYNAYNKWGGACYYTGATRVSFARPIERGYVVKPVDADGFDGRAGNVSTEPDPDHRRLQDYLKKHRVALWSNSSGWHNWERRFVRFAEARGHQFDYAINSDLEFRPEVVGGTRLVLSIGHDEYWSWGMRDTIDRHVAGGGNFAVFSGNAVYWQVRYEDDGQTMVCHKYTARQTDPVMGTSQQNLLTGIWSDPLVGRPENLTTGLSFCRGGYVRFGHVMPQASGAYTVWRPDHWAFEGTGLAYGDSLGLGSYIVAYEVDGCELQLENGIPRPTGSDGTPVDMQVLCTAPAHLKKHQPGRNESPPSFTFDLDGIGDLEYTAELLFGADTPENRNRITNGHGVMGEYRHPGGGTIFNAGLADWAYGLDHDPQVQRITENVLARLG